jgi:hypothetical protein
MRITKLLAGIAIAGSALFALPVAASASVAPHPGPVSSWSPKEICKTEIKLVPETVWTWKHHHRVPEVILVPKPVKVCTPWQGQPGGGNQGNGGGQQSGGQGNPGKGGTGKGDGCKVVTFSVSSVAGPTVTEAHGPAVKDNEEVTAPEFSATDYWIFDVHTSGGTTTFELSTTPGPSFSTPWPEGANADWSLTTVCPTTAS